jgi:hypothetical protein
MNMGSSKMPLLTYLTCCMAQMENLPNFFCDKVGPLRLPSQVVSPTEAVLDWLTKFGLPSIFS